MSDKRDFHVFLDGEPFTQYAPAVGVKMNDNSSSTTHVGSVGSSMYLSGEALLDELRRAGVL